MRENSLTFLEYYQRFTQQVKRLNGIEFTQLSNGAVAFRHGTYGPLLAVIAGVHGDERSGPLALLEWISSQNDPLFSPGIQLWLLPLLNDEGWDANKREWQGLDLNRSFLSPQRSPGLLLPILDEWDAHLPDVFLDLHEELDEYYLFRYPGDRHGMAEALSAHLEVKMVDWTDFDEWEGSDEVFLRRQGCSHCVTLEAAGNRPLEERVSWNLKAVKWCVDYASQMKVR